MLFWLARWFLLREDATDERQAQERHACQCSPFEALSYAPAAPKTRVKIVSTCLK